jgi:hypothetical protein
MRALSKSKLLAYRQCPKRLWLEVHRSDLIELSEATKARFGIGHQVSEIARKNYDPGGKGALIDIDNEGFKNALARTQTLLASPSPIFEAGFSAGGALAFSDILLPVSSKRKRAWRMVEVKSSASVKDYHRDELAIQAYVARKAGVPLAGIALAHIDSSWVYPGDDDYEGLLNEVDLTKEAFGREAEVEGWLADAQSVVSQKSEPSCDTGRHCDDPFECPFTEHCQSAEAQPEFPVSWLPRVQTKALRSLIDDEGIVDLREVPDALLNERQRRVKKHTLSGKVFFDRNGAASELSQHKLPGYFLDFETISFPVPIWKGTRPYQQIPFQFSLHCMSRNGSLDERRFIDLSGNDPSRAFAETLIETCGDKGPVIVYNAGFETARIRELAARFPRLRKRLLAINERVVDLLKIAERHYYHPSQQGSWSIKKVLPAIAPDLSYGDLDVQDGGMAIDAFLEAISPATTKERKAEIEEQLLAYCGLDTYAMVRIWRFFSCGKG